MDSTPRLPRLVPHLSGGKIEVRGGWISFLAVSEQTGGAYAVIETANDPSTGVRLHVHEREDETWFVIEGQYVFQVGDQTFHARVGDYVFGPRGVPHRYANQTASSAGRRASRAALLRRGNPRHDTTRQAIFPFGDLGQINAADASRHCGDLMRNKEIPCFA